MYVTDAKEIKFSIVQLFINVDNSYDFLSMVNVIG